ncbi:MAG: AAA family ATPase [Rhodospirillaceae bacterium]
MAFNNRYRPKTVSDIVFPAGTTRDDVYLQVNREIPAPTLIYGPFGSGKSAGAAAIARTLMVDNYEFNVMQRAGARITTVAQLSNITQFLEHVPVMANYKIVVIDELDSMPQPVQTALRDVMDTTSRHGVVLATANNLARIDGGLQDRFTKIYWGEPVPKLWLPRARQILASEGVAVADDILLTVLTNAGVSVREIMRALEDLADIARAEAAKR